MKFNRSQFRPIKMKREPARIAAAIAAQHATELSMISAVADLSIQKADEARRMADHYRGEIDQVCENIIQAVGRENALLPVGRSYVSDIQYARRWPIPRQIIADFARSGTVKMTDVHEMAVDLVQIAATLDRPQSGDRHRFERMIRIVDTYRTSRFEERRIGLSLDVMQMRGGKGRLARDEIRWILEPMFKQLEEELLHG